ncbi:globin [Corynebacterium epidermidicanis]|uniref:Truncated hemoglobin n=1 Tax=Corynebacterium epidermidicanis TaxID=1050174 RepID=A0A0G3GRR1_9CORY|nr:globin [Corynebacterium epidermidicanis]AKK03809.1 truncated hemoglobin [Corynebacterium epidermidicanis]
MTFYDEVGGQPTFDAIVDGFYAQIPDDDILGPMYPPEDMAGARDRLAWFLAQYWGGPQTFSEQRGHPRLRMRHAHFHVNRDAAIRWLELMKNSLDQIPETTLDDTHRAAMWEHMERVAAMLINRPD